MSTLKDWIKVYDNVISPELCSKLMDLIDTSGNIEDHNQPWRRCKIYTFLDQTVLYQPVREVIQKAFDRYKIEMANGPLNQVGVLESPQIMKYSNDDNRGDNWFNWHADCWNMDTATRQISTIIYLNDVEDGGSTSFHNLGVSAKPKKGSILIFPSSFLFIHQGEPPRSNPKYIIVSWIHFNGNGHSYRVSPLYN